MTEYFGKGWFRLWIVVSVALLVVSVIFAWGESRTEPGFDRPSGCLPGTMVVGSTQLMIVEPAPAAAQKTHRKTSSEALAEAQNSTSNIEKFSAEGEYMQLRREEMRSTPAWDELQPLVAKQVATYSCGTPASVIRAILLALVMSASLALCAVAGKWITEGFKAK